MTITDTDSEHVRLIDIESEVRTSFLEYAMSVIVSRALPDVRDGLKPVHRRILYSMYDAGIRPGTPFRKSARVVGDVMGWFHPHSNDAIYDALVRMGQDFAIRYGLIEPQGNFGTVDDPPAAMRYTECRLESLAMHLLESIDEDTVDFQDNYSGERQEPVVLPPASPTCWSTVPPASRWAWPPTSRPTTWARSSTPPSSRWSTPRLPPRTCCASSRAPTSPPGPASWGRGGCARPCSPAGAR